MNHVFGGESSAPMWKTFMTAVHKSPDIPQLPGLPLNPNQVIAMQQLAEAQKADPSLAHKNDGPQNAIPDKLKAALKDLENALRKAGAQASDGAPGTPERKAELAPASEPAVPASAGFGLVSAAGGKAVP